MRLIGRILGVLVILVIALVVIAYLLPGRATVSRSVTIAAPADAIFPHVNSMKKTEAWSPWMARDPQVQLTYSGPEEGVGNRLDWASDNPQVGTGSQEITDSVANESVTTAIDFGPMGTAIASFELTPGGEGTEVTWGFETDLGMNPVSRWMGLMMDRLVGGDYEQGLANLKKLVEAQG